MKFLNSRQRPGIERHRGVAVVALRHCRGVVLVVYAQLSQFVALGHLRKGLLRVVIIFLVRLFPRRFVELEAARGTAADGLLAKVALRLKREVAWMWMARGDDGVIHDRTKEGGRSIGRLQNQKDVKMIGSGMGVSIGSNQVYLLLVRNGSLSLIGIESIESFSSSLDGWPLPAMLILFAIIYCVFETRKCI